MSSQKIISQLKLVKKASAQLRWRTSLEKNEVLLTLAKLLKENKKIILRANAQDLKNLPSKKTAAFRDRLLLTDQRIDQMITSLQAVADLSDPVGEIAEVKTLGNGLLVRKVRSPLGVIFMIFESRPNVALEAFSLGFKAGNAMILRGGSESVFSTKIIYKLIHGALKASGFDQHMLWGITDPDRALPNLLLKEKDFIDVVVPRGGEELIKFVVKNSEIPVIKHDRGLCHVYVHEDASSEMALKIIVNGKTQKPSACNSIETILVHEKIAAVLLPKLYQAMAPLGVEWRVCSKSAGLLKSYGKLRRALNRDWDTEYLDLILNCRVVADLEMALEHIETHGTHHSEVIVTSSERVARHFQDAIDAATVYWNASSRFTDGFELGLGGELGISTQKLHVRGPVGLKELTSLRWVIDGTGQVRF